MNDKTLEALAAPLNPALISVLPAGPAQGEPYLETYVVIAEANAIFGAGQWGFVLDCPPFVLAKGDDPNKPGKNDVWAAIGRVTLVGGEAQGDMGTNTQSGPGPTAVEMSAKGAVSDCLKRCMTHLADRLGLVLRDKQVNRAEIERRWREYMGERGGEAPPVNTPAPAKPAWTKEEFLAELQKSGVAADAVCAVIGVAKASAWRDVQPAIDAWLKADEARTIKSLISTAADQAAQPAGAWR